tara:strand:+ start:313 stop:504 length:192 start_codon:yes stop_codon:yes gene_type:complete
VGQHNLISIVGSILAEFRNAGFERHFQGDDSCQIARASVLEKAGGDSAAKEWLQLLSGFKGPG